MNISFLRMTWFVSEEDREEIVSYRRRSQSGSLTVVLLPHRGDRIKPGNFPSEDTNQRQKTFGATGSDRLIATGPEPGWQKQKGDIQHFGRISP
jgi:hypothetical protein